MKFLIKYHGYIPEVPGLQEFECEVDAEEISSTVAEIDRSQGRVYGVEPVLTQHFERVLDHGYVKLIDYMGDDLRPLRNARLSTDRETGVDEAKDDGLRRHLWSNQHVSPFQSCVASFELSVPLFVLRQIDRHRTVCLSEMKMIEDYDSFRAYSDRNEFSARYSEMPDLFYVPLQKRFQRKGTVNKQGSEGLLPPEVQQECQQLVEQHSARSREVYELLLARGVASELARIVLPVGQYTKIQLQASMLNWFNFLKLRMAEEAQYETRLFANSIAAGLQKLWPRSYEVFTKYSLNGITFSNEERQYLHAVLDHAATGTRHTYSAEARAAVHKKLGIAA